MTYMELNYIERRINSIRAEQLAHALFGGECQIAFKDGKMLEKRCKGCVVIDIIRALPDGWQEAIEVKYFNGCYFRDPYDFAIALRTQLNNQKINMPKKVKQRVFVLCKGIDADILKEILVERLSKRIVIDVLEYKEKRRMTYMEALSKIETADSLDLLKDEALRTTIIDALTFGIKIIQYSEQFTEEDIMNDAASIKIKNLSRAKHKGEWIQKGVVGGGEYIYECSECHHTDTRSRFLEVPFCWFCGARMKTGDEGLTELKYMIDEKINYLRSRAKWEEADDFERKMRNIIARLEEEG